MKKTPGESALPPLHHSAAANLPSNTDIALDEITFSQPAIFPLLELFIEQLKAIYWMELQQVQSLSAFIDHIDAQEFIDVLLAHRSLTELQITRCEEVFAAMQLSQEAVPTPMMTVYFQETPSLYLRYPKGVMRDASILLAIQQGIMHEIATYRTLCHWARLLQEFELSNMLEDTLSEETQTDERLSMIGTAMFRSTHIPIQSRHK